MKAPMTLAAALLVFVACGDSGNSGVGSQATQPDCSPLVPCGGDLTGTWRIVGQCATASNCPGAVYDHAKGSMEITFAGGNVTYAGAGTAHYSLPLSCIAAPDGGVAGCVNGVAGWDCMKTATACECDVDLARIAASIGSQPYTVTGNQFKIGPLPASYCITGNALRFSVTIAGLPPGPVNHFIRK